MWVYHFQNNYAIILRTEEITTRPLPAVKNTPFTVIGINFSNSSAVNVSKILFPKLEVHMLTHATSLLLAMNRKSIVILPRFGTK